MIRIAQIELLKYVRAFVLIIIGFVLLEAVFVSRVEARNFFHYGTFDFETFKVVNSSLTTLIASAIPFTIILNICNEFSNGYALKLISNGFSRSSYCRAKFTLASALAIIATLLYLLIILLLQSIQKTTYFDRTIFTSSVIEVLFFSMFFSSIAVSVSLLIRNWPYTLLVYYGYFIIESFVAYRFENSAPWVKYLPFYFAGSMFQLKAVPEQGGDYLRPAGILIPFCLIIVWCCYHFFKKADL
jgi:hypothetical protein